MSGAVGSQGVPRHRLVVCDVAMFYAARSGGIRTYLDEKARFARSTDAFEHHVVVPGRRERHGDGRHELRSLELAASNGYRIPFGTGALKDTLRAVRPDVVILHDPFWRPHDVTREAHRLGARVVAVHHASPALNAAGLPGPDAVYVPLLKRIYRRAYARVDAVMSVVDPSADAGRSATIPLRFGLDPAFRPKPAVRGDHLLYAGRVAHDKRIPDLLAAMAGAGRRRPLWIVGEGPARGSVESCVQRLGLTADVRFIPSVGDRERLASLYREAACVVDPGPYETFGLVVLEAAASGARVVAATSTPSAHVAAPLVELFAPKDVPGLRRAIDRALATPGDGAAAAALSARLRWEEVFAAERADLERLLG